MKIEFENIIRAYRNIDFTHNKAALATILNVKGSSYRRPGARMLIEDNGNWTGAISGGCLEKDALRKALTVMQHGKAKIVTYDTTDEDENVFGIGLGCNGIIDVLIEPLHPGEKGNPLELLDQLLTVKEQAVMVTLFGEENITGERKIYRSDNTVVSTMKDGALEAVIDKLILTSDKNFVREIEDDKHVLVEVLEPDIQLLVFGTGYDALPLVRMGRLAGCHVTVLFSNPNQRNGPLFAEADAGIFSSPEDLLKNVAVSRFSAAILLSHNFNYDLAILQQLLKTDIPYIGILGPQKKGLKIKEQVGHLEDADLQRLYNPVGLDIGAETPEEIALSIIAEIKAVFSGRSGQMLRLREGPIYSRG
jgi:xanthine/CO dehydrogenase XdhC/CoxF family maturation factor